MINERTLPSGAHALLNKAIPWLFCCIGLLQILDLHSTLLAVDTRGETNNLINLLASFIGVAGAVIAFKGAVALSLLFSYRTWRKNPGEYDGFFALGLLVMIGAYALVIVSNYYAR